MNRNRVTFRIAATLANVAIIFINIACDNGVIHVIDTVLTLPTAKSTAS